MKILGVILSRYASTRFPGKPLADICGKPMVWWVYNNAKNAKKVDKVIVATDDDRIANVCSSYDIPYVMTRKDHGTPAERLQEVSEKIEADFYVGINGDEPLIEPRMIDSAVPDIDEIPLDVEFGTNLISEINDPALVMDPANIKMVFDDKYNALYMSRSPIPFPYDTLNFKYYKHVGILGYNKKMLDFYKESKPGRFETIEGIATLRFLDYGKQLKLIEVKDAETLSVDTPKDLEEVKKIILKNKRN